VKTFDDHPVLAIGSIALPYVSIKERLLYNCVRLSTARWVTNFMNNYYQ